MSYTSASSNIPCAADVLRITALPIERAAVVRHFEGCETVCTYDDMTYYMATVSTNDCAVDVRVAVTMLNQTGNVEAANHANSAIRDVQPEYVLMVGIAGGVREHVRLGDVVVADQVLYYEPAKEKPGNTQTPRRASFRSSPAQQCQKL